MTYKLSVAALYCALNGKYCDYAFGNGPQNDYGATTQTDMGIWSDGTPVTPMLLVADPVAQYPTCPTGGGQ